MSRSRRSRTVRAPNGVVPGNSAGKGTWGRKFNIMRSYRHGAPGAEERAIEHRERQLAKKAILSELRVMSIDVLTVIDYDMVDPSRSTVYTNARPEMLSEILLEWCVDQVGSGGDASKAIERDRYVVKLGLEMMDGGDNFFVQSDTGNRSLTLGIVMDVLARDTLSIRSLEEIPRDAAARTGPTEGTAPCEDRAGDRTG